MNDELLLSLVLKAQGAANRELAQSPACTVDIEHIDLSRGTAAALRSLASWADMFKRQLNALAWQQGEREHMAAQQKAEPDAKTLRAECARGGMPERVGA